MYERGDGTRCAQRDAWFQTPGNVWGIDVRGYYAYLTDSTTGRIVVDISNAHIPTLAGSSPEPHVDLDEYDVEVVDDCASVTHAYVAAETAGVQIFNIGIPDSPTLIAAVDTPDSANDVVVFGDYACAADGNTGLQLIDLKP